MKELKKVVTAKQVLYACACAVIFLGVFYTILSSRGEITEALGYLHNMKMSVILIIPTIWLMYIAAGKIWQPYLNQKTGLLARIQYELNFVNTVVPFLNILSGLAYAIARLKKLGVSEGRATGMYSFRYLITILTKWIEITIAITILTVMGKTGDMPSWTIYPLLGMAAVIILGLSVGVVAVLGKVRISQRLTNHPKIREIAQTIELAFSDRRALMHALVWGMIYSFLEILPFWVVAAAMGHPELLLQIIVASGAAIIAGIIIPTPMGVGGFDGVMVLFLSGMGESVALVSAITVVTRTIILVSTTVTGIPFWINGMRQIK